MNIVNFSIPSTLEKRLIRTIKEKGFASKAEFFRFAAIYFMDIIDKPVMSEDKRFDYLTSAISSEVSRRYKNKKVPNIRKQLADI